MDELSYHNKQKGDIPKLLFICVCLEAISLIVLFALGIFTTYALMFALIVHTLIYFGFKDLTIEHKSGIEPYLSISFGPLNLCCASQSKRIYYNDISCVNIIPFQPCRHGYGLHFRRCNTLIYSNAAFTCCRKRNDYLTKSQNDMVFEFTLKDRSKLKCGCKSVRKFMLVTNDSDNLKKHLLDCHVLFENSV